MATRKQPETAEKSPIYIPIGVTGVDPRSGDGSDEWLRPLRGRQGMLMYREMMDNCSEIGAALLLIETLVKRADLKVEPWDPSSHDAYAEAEFIETVLDDMCTPMSQIRGESTRNALGYGWSAHEIIYKRRLGMRAGKYNRSFYSDGKIGIADVSPRPPHTLDQWEYNEWGDATGFVQQSPNLARVFLPVDRLFHFRVLHNNRLPEGRSILRHSYRSWMFLKRFQEMEGIVYSKGPGVPIMRVPPELLSSGATSAEQAILTNIKKLASTMTLNEYSCFILPAKQLEDGKFTGYDVEFKGGGNAGGMPIRTAILDLQKQILTSLHAAFIVLGQGATGSFSLASSLTSTFAHVVEAILREFCEQFTRQVIWRLEYMRGVDPTLWPYITVGDVTPPSLQELANFVSQLVLAGVIEPDDHLERRLREIGELPEKGAPRIEANSADLQDAVNRFVSEQSPAGIPAQGTSPATFRRGD